MHANFAEYVPFALLLLAMMEMRGAPVVILHLLCGCLLLARLSHAWGVSRAPEDYRFRAAGIATTLTVIGCTAISLLIL